MLTLNNLSWLIRTIDSYSVSGYQRLVLSYTIPYIHIRSYSILFMHGDTRVGRYHKNGDSTVLKFYGITKYHGIVIINYCIHLKSFKLLLCPECIKIYLKNHIRRWFPQVKLLSCNWLLIQISTFYTSRLVLAKKFKC